MNQKSYFKIMAFVSSLQVGFCAGQEQTDVDAIIQQATELAVAGQAEDSARILLEAYDDATSINDSTRLLNLALKHHYDLENYETVRALSQEAIDTVPPEDEKYFQARSQAYGFLAKYIIEHNNDYGNAMPLLAICGKGADSRIEEWCDEEIDNIRLRQRNAVLSDLNDRLLQNKTSFWLTIFITFGGIILFGWSVFRDKPA